jgi:hypothetical protein
MSLSVEEAKTLGREHCRDIPIDAAITAVMDKTRSNSRIQKEEKKPVAAAELEALKLNVVSVILEETGYDKSKAGLVYTVPAVEDAFVQVRKLAQKIPGLQKQDYENLMRSEPGKEPTPQVQAQSDDAYAYLIGAVVYNAGLLEEGPGVLRFPGSRSSPDDDAPRTHLLKFNEQVEVRRMEEQPDDRDLRADQRNEVRDKAPAKQKRRKTTPAQALPGDPVSLTDPKAPKKSSKGKDKKRPVSPPPPVTNETESENDESVHGGPAPKAPVPVVQAVSPPENRQDLPVVQAEPVPQDTAGGRAKKQAKRLADGAVQTDFESRVDGAVQTDFERRVDGAVQTDFERRVDGAVQTDLSFAPNLVVTFSAMVDLTDD